jgi:Na+/proline symporter
MNAAMLRTLTKAVDGRPRLLRPALEAAVRWIGWWMTTAMVVAAGAATVAFSSRPKGWNLKVVEFLASVAMAGTLLGVLLWRRKRTKDGAVASIILTAGFWVAVWVFFWTLPAD